MYSHNDFQPCKPVLHFLVPCAHTLLGPVCCITWHYLCGALTVPGSVVLLYICTLIHPLFTSDQRTKLQCTTVRSLVPAWPLSICKTLLYNRTLGRAGLAWPLSLYCRTGLLRWDNPHEPRRPITVQLRFFCFALIGPLRVGCCCCCRCCWIAACWNSHSALQKECVKRR